MKQNMFRAELTALPTKLTPISISPLVIGTTINSAPQACEVNFILPFPSTLRAIVNYC